MPAALVMFAVVCIASAFGGEMKTGCAPKKPAGMVMVPGGTFKPMFRSITDPKEIPVAPFLLDEVPVTNADYLEFVRANPQWQRRSAKRLFADVSYLKNWTGDLEPGPDAPAKAPVTFVSWFAAKAYAQWKGKRLPTQAEWELAGAASVSRADGSNDPALTRTLLDWYAAPNPPRLPEVGRGTTNYFGLKDMHGLIWEWVADFSEAMVTGDARGDSGLDRQLFCGSAAADARDPSNYAAFMRYGFRSSLKGDYCLRNLGFRCAKNLEATNP